MSDREAIAFTLLSASVGLRLPVPCSGGGGRLGGGREPAEDDGGSGWRNGDDAELKDMDCRRPALQTVFRLAGRLVHNIVGCDTYRCARRLNHKVPDSAR